MQLSWLILAQAQAPIMPGVRETKAPTSVNLQLKAPTEGNLRLPPRPLQKKGENVVELNWIWIESQRPLQKCKTFCLLRISTRHWTGGSLAVLQDHPVSNYHPGIFQFPTQDKGETPILKDILRVFFFYSLSLTILPLQLTMDELAVIRGS